MAPGITNDLPRADQPRGLEGAQVMATFIQLHQGQRVVLVNLDQVKVIATKKLKTGSEVLFSDSTEIDVDEVLADIEIMMRFKP
jgi:hypothetical protein